MKLRVHIHFFPPVPIQMSRAELRKRSEVLQGSWDALRTSEKRDSKLRPPAFEEFSAKVTAAQQSGILDACDVDDRNTYWKAVASETAARECRAQKREDDERRAVKLRRIAQDKKRALWAFLVLTILTIAGGIGSYFSGNDPLKIVTALLGASAVVAAIISLYLIAS